MDRGLSYQDILSRLNLPEPAELVTGERRIHRAMRVLPDSPRIVLVLGYFYGYSRSEVADLLQLPESTIQTWQLHGLRGLRSLI